MYYRTFVPYVVIYYALFTALVLAISAIVEWGEQSMNLWTWALSWMICTVLFSALTLIYNRRKILELEGVDDEIQSFLVRQIESMHYEKKETPDRSTEIYEDRYSRRIPLNGPIILERKGDVAYRLTGPSRFLKKLYDRIDRKYSGRIQNIGVS